MFSPRDILRNFSEIGATRAVNAPKNLLMLGFLGGFVTGVGSAVANTAAHAILNASIARVVSGLLFAFGLGVIMLLGAELITGNCMMVISVLEKKARWRNVLKNWCCVYAGNLMGGILLAAGCAFFGQLDLSDGALAVYTIRVAAAKCAIPPQNGMVLGMLCNLLVCMGVLGAMSAKDTAGKILGAYLPVAFFVICGFENSVANMYYIPAGLFAMRVSEYAKLAAEAGVATQMLTWQNCFVGNLLPVTVGNMASGIGIGCLLWMCYLREGTTERAYAPEKKDGCKACGEGSRQWADLTERQSL